MPVSRLASANDIIAALPTVFENAPAVPVRTAVTRLREAGLRLPARAAEAADAVIDTALLSDDPIVGYLSSTEELVDSAAVLDGAILTHRLSQREVDADALEPGADLPGMALDAVAARGLLLPDGRIVQLGGRGLPLHGCLTIEELGAGDLVGVRFDRDQARLAAVEGVDSPAALAPPIRERLPRHAGRHLDDLFDELLMLPGLFRTPLPPLGEVLQMLGFGCDGEQVALSPKVLAETLLDSELEELIREYDLTEEEALGVLRAQESARSLEADPTDPGPFAPDLGEVIADPWLAFVVAERALALDDPAPDGLAQLADRLRSTIGTGTVRRARAGARYLLGRVQEHLGDPLAAEKEYTQALSADADHPYALLGLAGIAADRGLFATAQRLIDEAGASPGHPLRIAVQWELEQPAEAGPTLGRNEPCWCGSGRKYKVCHGRASGAAAPVRAQSVLGLALAWEAHVSPSRMGLLFGIAGAIAGRAGQDAVVPLVPDLLLFEGGRLADYLQRRAQLLPAEVVMTAERWLLAPRSLFDVEAVRKGQGLTLRNLLTGDRVEVQERAASRQLTPGTLLLTRLAAVGDHLEIFGGAVAVPLAHRDALLDLLSTEPDPVQLVEFVAGLSAPPKLRTPEGDPLRHLAGRFTTTSPAKLRQQLDRLLGPAQEGVWSLLEPGLAGSRILATASLQGKTLTVSAISAPRYERFVAVLDQTGVPLVEKDRTVTDPTEARPGPEQPSRPLGADEIAEHPELAAHIASYIRNVEQQWLDEPIPALGGATPRQAAQDPTRREDLLRLLAGLPSDGSPFAMDSGRLRAALGF